MIDWTQCFWIGFALTLISLFVAGLQQRSGGGKVDYPYCNGSKIIETVDSRIERRWACSGTGKTECPYCDGKGE